MKLIARFLLGILLLGALCSCGEGKPVVYQSEEVSFGIWGEILNCYSRNTEAYRTEKWTDEQVPKTKTVTVGGFSYSAEYKESQKSFEGKTSVVIDSYKVARKTEFTIERESGRLTRLEWQEESKDFEPQYSLEQARLAVQTYARSLGVDLQRYTVSEYLSGSNKRLQIVYERQTEGCRVNDRLYVNISLISGRFLEIINQNFGITSQMSDEKLESVCLSLQSPQILAAVEEELYWKFSPKEDGKFHSLRVNEYSVSSKSLDVTSDGRFVMYYFVRADISFHPVGWETEERDSCALCFIVESPR